MLFYFISHVHEGQRRRGLKQYKRGTKLRFFLQRRLWLITISILLINLLTVGFLARNFAFFDDNFGTRRFSDNFPTTENWGEGEQLPLPTPHPRLHWRGPWAAARFNTAREVGRKGESALLRRDGMLLRSSHRCHRWTDNARLTAAARRASARRPLL